MHCEINKQILDEINRLDSLKRGKVVGRNDSGKTTITSLGKFYSEVIGNDLWIGLKEYSIRKANSLHGYVASELGLIDLVEANLPYLVEEFPLFHGLFLDRGGKQKGIITEDYSKNGTIPVENIFDFNRSVLPYELQKLVNRPNDLSELASTSFLVNGKRRIGDFGAFTMGDSHYKLRLAKKYIRIISDYSVDTPVERD